MNIDEKNIDEKILQCVLVECNARKVYYIQHMEIIDDDIANLQEKFPTLIFEFVHKYQVWGYLVSKVPLEESDYNTHEKMGILLGYPCASDFSDIGQTNSVHNQDIKYGFSVVYISKNENEIHLIDNLCKTDTKEQQFNELGQLFADCFKKHELTKNDFEKIRISRTITYSVDYLIAKVEQNSILNDNEKHEILNIIENISMYKIQKYLDFNNDLHKKIILMLLYNFKYSILEPYFPLSVEMNKINDDITKQLEDKIIHNILLK